MEEARRYDDGVLMLYGPGSVRKLREEFAAAGFEITEFWDEPDYVSVKVRDPDGYVVETSWEP